MPEAGEAASGRAGDRPGTGRPDGRGSPRLERLIPPEVRGGRFYRAMSAAAATPGVRHILEIGSSSGEGSTRAFVEGALRNPEPPLVHCLEVSRTRLAALLERYRRTNPVRTYRLSSVPLERFASPAEVERFYREERSRLRNVRLEKVLRWLREDLEYVRREGLSEHGIRRIREAHGIETFDAVLIDGSEFTARAELDEVYGAAFLFLDDTRSFKNLENRRRLDEDPAYRRIASSRWRRNGYAVYRLADRAGARGAT